MPDLFLDASRPFALVTTVRRAGPRTSRVHPQIDLDLPGYTLRLRFADAGTLALFSGAVGDLVSDVITHSSQTDADVCVRVVNSRQPIQIRLPY